MDLSIEDILQEFWTAVHGEKASSDDLHNNSPMATEASHSPISADITMKRDKLDASHEDKMTTTKRRKRHKLDAPIEDTMTTTKRRKSNTDSNDENTESKKLEAARQEQRRRGITQYENVPRWQRTRWKNGVTNSTRFQWWKATK